MLSPREKDADGDISFAVGKLIQQAEIDAADQTAWSAWCVDDWLGEERSVGSVLPTDIDATAAEWRAEALWDNVWLLGDVAEYIRTRIADAQDDLADANPGD